MQSLSCTHISTTVDNWSCNFLVIVNILKDCADLIQSAIISLLATLAILRNQSGTWSEILFVFLYPKVSLVHLASHILEVFKDAYLVLLIFPIKESLVGVLIVLNAFICRLVDVKWCRIASLEDSVSVELLKQLIVKLLLLLQGAFPDWTLNVALD